MLLLLLLHPEGKSHRGLSILLVWILGDVHSPGRVQGEKEWDVHIPIATLALHASMFGGAALKFVEARGPLSPKFAIHHCPKRGMGKSQDQGKKVAEASGLGQSMSNT